MGDAVYFLVMKLRGNIEMDVPYGLSPAEEKELQARLVSALTKASDLISGWRAEIKPTITTGFRQDG